MAIFTRRRLQSMLDDLSDLLASEKGADLVNRVEDKRVEQALPGEMELGLLWALQKLGDFEIEPDWWGDDCRPDAYSEALIPGQPTVVEIAAVSDNAISGQDAMDRVARELMAVANRVKKRVGEHLYFKFGDESGYDEAGEYFRRRLAPANYRASNAASEAVSRWIESGTYSSQAIRISEPGLDVTIEHKAHRPNRFHNVWSSMPPETHSVTSNPLYGTLRRKLRQLRAASPDTLRLICLCDVGSRLLNRIGDVGELDPSRRRRSGREIIRHFISSNADRVDGVIVFSPRRKGHWHQRQLEWGVATFSARDLPGLSEGLTRLVSILPAPRFEGYQARSLFQQGAYAPASRGWYVGMSVTSKIGSDLTVRFPARLFLDLLAGRITQTQFLCHVQGGVREQNLFQHWLNRGLTIVDAEMAPRDVDQDDDHLILRFGDDPAARPLRFAGDKAKDTADRAR